MTRFRGMGRGRSARRTLAQGGSGLAQRLNDALGTWPGVRITPMFGLWGYFVGPRLFGCFPLRPKDRDLWIHLAAEDQARALRDSRIRPHRRFARRGWVELAVGDPADVGLALHWLRRAYTTASGAPEEDNDG
jgi:luciferase-like monooxygenase